MWGSTCPSFLWSSRVGNYLSANTSYNVKWQKSQYRKWSRARTRRANKAPPSPRRLCDIILKPTIRVYQRCLIQYLPPYNCRYTMDRFTTRRHSSGLYWPPCRRTSSSRNTGGRSAAASSSSRTTSRPPSASSNWAVMPSYRTVSVWCPASAAAYQWWPSTTPSRRRWKWLWRSATMWPPRPWISPVSMPIPTWSSPFVRSSAPMSWAPSSTLSARTYPIWRPLISTRTACPAWRRSRVSRSVCPIWRSSI